MAKHSWIRKWFTRPAARTIRKAPRTFRPTLEVLEARITPSTITVMNNNDAGGGSLRAALSSAVNGDVINFAPVLTGGQTITETSGTLNITSNVTITGSATGVTIDGGNRFGVFNVGSGVTASLTGLTITHGRSGGGAGVFNSGTLTVSQDAFIANVTANGGGIENFGTLTVNDSTFTGNSASANGAGIFSSATLTVNDSTFTGNSAASGGGVYISTGTGALNGNILVGNTGGGGADDVNGAASPAANSMNNVVGVDATNTLTNGANGNQVGVADAGLLGLGNWGGPTQTFALSPTSVAVGKGQAAAAETGALANDQRGVARPTTGNADAGAYQFSTPATVTVAAGDVNGLIAALSPDTTTTINLTQSTYDFTQANNFWYGPDALPAVSRAVTINGNGATLQRDAASGTPNFRFFYVSGNLMSGLPAGSLSLNNLTLQGGEAKGGDSNIGGGGLGAGGAIFNQGTLNLNGVTLTGNTAVGGSGGVGTANGGGGIGQSGQNVNGGGFGGAFPGGVGGGGAFPGGGGGFNASATDINGGGQSGLGGAGGFGGGSGGDGGGGGGGDPAGGGGNFGFGGASDGLDIEGGGGGGVGGGGGFGAGGGGGFGGGGGGSRGVTAGFGGFGAGGGAGGTGGVPGGFGGGSGGLAVGGSGGGGGAGLGGAVFSMYGSVNVVNSTFTANTADGGSAVDAGAGQGLGGAIFNLDGTVSLTNATLARDIVSSDGGELYNLDYGRTPNGATVNATATIINSILANSTGGTNNLVNNTDASAGAGRATVNLAGPNIIRTSNTIGAGTGIHGVGLRITSDPMLGALADNGGLTPTLALLSGSPAIDHGDNTPVFPGSFDQRGPGFARIVNNTVDIGAFENQPTVQFANATQTVAENGGPQMIMVTLSAATTVDVTVPITLGGTAVFGTNYTVSAASITIRAGQTSGSLTLTPTDDGKFSTSNKTVTFTLGTLTDASAGTTNSDAVTIAESDPAPTVSFAVASQSVDQAAGTFAVTVNLSAASLADTTIPFTLGGTAAAGVDYSNVSMSPLVIKAGQTTATISGTLPPDPGPGQTLTVTLGTPTNATLGATTSDTLTITEPSPPPPPPSPSVTLPPSVSVAFGPIGEVLELVNSAGVLTQFDAAGAHVLGGGVRSASVAFGPAGEVVEVVGVNGVLMQFDASGAHQLGGAGVESASVAFGPSGEVLDVVLVDGSARQFSAGGVQLLAANGVVSASVAFGPAGEVVDVVSTAGALTQFDASGAHQLGEVGVQSAGVAFTANSEVLDIIFAVGSLDQFDALGVHRLGILS